MHEVELKELWRGSAAENQAMSIEQLRNRAAKFQRSVRLRDMVEYVACVLVVIAFGAYIWIFPNYLSKIGSAVMVAATVFVAFQLRKHAVGRNLPPKNSTVSLAEFHKMELMRRRDLLKKSWKLLVGPLMPGMLLFLAGIANEHPEAELPALMFSGFVVVMGLAISLGNMWYARRLQRDIDVLDTLVAAE